jgi:hypothetical protein
MATPAHLHIEGGKGFLGGMYQDIIPDKASSNNSGFKGVKAK